MTEEVLPALRSIPALGEALPGPFDADREAASHQFLFGRQVLPYASVFLERDGVLGGPVSESVSRAFQRAELPGPPAGEAADHLGHELALLASLTERGDRPGVNELLSSHLLWWLPHFVHSASRHATGVWPAVLRLTLEAAVDQARSVAPPGRVGGSGGASPSPLPPGALALPVDDPLADSDAGLSRVARHLVSPARGGLYLALADLGALAREIDAPAGFGRRRRVMVNLLRSAAGFGGLDLVARRLRALAEAQAAFLEVVPSAYRSPWTERLDGLARVLDRLALEGGTG